MSGRANRNGWNLVINLASQPRRNRRPYRFLRAGLSLLIAAGLVVLALLNLNSWRQFRDLRDSNRNLEEKKTGLGVENSRLNREVESWRRLYGDRVEEINSLLEKKSGSWVAFFSRMEEALPPGCYLLALNPPASAAGREYRIRVAMNNREELGRLIQNLQLQNFEEVRVLNENYQDNRFQVEMIFRDARIN